MLRAGQRRSASAWPCRQWRARRSRRRGAGRPRRTAVRIGAGAGDGVGVPGVIVGGAQGAGCAAGGNSAHGRARPATQHFKVATPLTLGRAPLRRCLWGDHQSVARAGTRPQAVSALSLFSVSLPAVRFLCGTGRVALPGQSGMPWRHGRCRRHSLRRAGATNEPEMATSSRSRRAGTRTWNDHDVTGHLIHERRGHAAEHGLQ
jgi:hypothetical protein